MSNIEIPAKGKAAVCVNEGPEFRVEVQDVDIPEPSEFAGGEVERPCIDRLRQRMVSYFSDSTARGCACTYTRVWELPRGI